MYERQTMTVCADPAQRTELAERNIDFGRSDLVRCAQGMAASSRYTLC